MTKLVEYINEIEETSNNDLMFEMSNLGTKTTGLPCVIWIQVNVEDQLKGRHNVPRLKIRNCDKKFIPISIEDDPKLLGNCTIKDTDLSSKEFNEVRNYIINNKEILLKYWNDKFECIEDLIDELKNENT